MSKPRLISGIQPSGRLHIGNYLGALKNFVDLQNSGKYECFFFVADYHSLTSNYDKDEKSKEINNVIKSYLIAGLDPKKSNIFIQSSILEHANLAWILSTLAPYGNLSRMTQFKEKSEKQKNNINVGLFYYPVLMASDVLLYDAKYVPVGEDQIQHLELTRNLARRFNKKFGDTLLEPKPLMTKATRIMSLNDPDSKMSKSIPNGCLFLDDSPEEINNKISKAVTDSDLKIKFDPKKKKAVSNLIIIYSEFSGRSIKEIEYDFKDKSYADFKENLTDLLVGELSVFRDDSIKKSRIKSTLKKGNQKAKKIAAKKLKEVKNKIGLIT
ncbi:MAG: tryptophan--tRNA ligase [Candidatus Paceibacterota bacterium]